MRKGTSGILVIVIALLALAAYALVRIAPRAAAPTQQQDAMPQFGADMYRGGYGWTFVPAGTEAGTELPLTHVSVKVNGKDYDLGTHAGSCSALSDEQLLPEEVSGVLCWFGGGGNELGVFKEGNGLVIKQGVQDEGDAENGGFRGDFKTIVRL